MFDELDDISIDKIKKEDSILYSDFSARIINALCSHGIIRFSELERRTEKDLLKIRNLGKVSVTEIKTKLASMGKCLKANEENSEKDSRDGFILLFPHKYQ